MTIWDSWECCGGWRKVTDHNGGFDSNAGIKRDACIDSKTSIVVKASNTLKKVFDTIAIKDS